MNPNVSTTQEKAVGYFKISGYQHRTVWYNSVTQMYTITNEYGESVDDMVPKEFRSLEDLRSTYVERYTSIEFLEYNKYNVPIMTAGME